MASTSTVKLILYFFHYSDTDSSPHNIMEVDDTPDFLLSSVVPRLHAVVSYKLEHSNPCLPSFDLSNIGMTQRVAHHLCLIKLTFFNNSISSKFFFLEVL